ncbi:MAG: hypothetical protein R3E57_02505 [Porticoccaceae bacterium]
MIIKYKKSALLWFVILFLYSVFSSPFPKVPGLVEMVLGSGLIVAVLSHKNLFALLQGRVKREDVFSLVSLIIFTYFLIVPSLNFVLGDWELNDYVRDLVPLIYLSLPFLIRHGSISSDSRNIFLFGLIFSGVAFSVRYFYESGLQLNQIGKIVCFDNDGYYPFDPTVTFSMIYCLCCAFLGKVSLLLRILLMTSGLVCAAALFGVAQRAPIGLLILSMSILFFAETAFMRLFVVLLVAIAVWIFFEGAIESVFSVLIEKQLVYGDNNKIAEFKDVLSALDTPTKIFFGLGWGALFDSSAYDGLTSNTHSIISYFIVKTGAIGSLFLFIYISFFLVSAVKLFLNDRVLALSIVSALFIGLLLQPTYKTLSFGILLLVLSQLGGRQNVEFERLGEGDRAFEPQKN